jgi:hypothetical protein
MALERGDLLVLEQELLRLVWPCHSGFPRNGFLVVDRGFPQRSAVDPITQIPISLAVRLILVEITTT